MRVYKAIGLAMVILVVAAAVVVWAPEAAARQGTTATHAHQDKMLQATLTEHLAHAESQAQAEDQARLKAAEERLKAAQEQLAAVKAGDQARLKAAEERLKAAQERIFAAQARVTAGPGGVYVVAGGPRLGVSIRDVETADVAKFKLTTQAGVVVEDVTKDSAAAKAGIKAGDVIVQFDGEAVRSLRQFQRLVSETTAGRTVKIGVMREGKRTDVEATLSNTEGPLTDVFVDRDNIRREVEQSLKTIEPMIRQFRLQRAPGDTVVTVPRASGGGTFTWSSPLGVLLAGRGRLGVQVQELTPELATYFGVKDGVLVAAVTADSPAAKAGIKAGDVITAVNDKAVTDSNSLVKQLSDKDGEITISLSRDKKAMSLKATVEKAKAGSASRIVVKREG